MQTEELSPNSRPLVLEAMVRPERSHPRFAAKNTSSVRIVHLVTWESFAVKSPKNGQVAHEEFGEFLPLDLLLFRPPPVSERSRSGQRCGCGGEGVGGVQGGRRCPMAGVMAR